MKKIGVTGAAGFVGSHLCERLLAEDYEVVGVDDLSYGSMANMEPFLQHRGFKFEVLDCTQRRPLRAAFDGCDAIMHLAAKKIPRYGGTLATLEVNVTGVNAACSVALALDADVIVTSTSDVYGDGTPPYREDGQLVIGPPTSKRWAYAVSKMYDEHHALVGRKVSVVEAGSGKLISGRCAGLDSTGRLILRDRRKTHPVIAGQVRMH